MSEQVTAGLITLMAVYSGAKVYKIELGDGEQIKKRSDIEPYLIEHGINFSNADMIIQPGEMGLPSPDSAVVLPEAKQMTYDGQVRMVRAIGLFLTPTKNDSGARVNIDGAENSWIRSEAKRLYKSGDAGKAHFTKDGKPYNSVSTDDLRGLLKSWYAKEEAGEATTVVEEEQTTNLTYSNEAEILEAVSKTVEDSFQILTLTCNTLNDLNEVRVETICDTQSKADLPDLIGGISTVLDSLKGYKQQVDTDAAACREEIARREAAAKAAKENVQETTTPVGSLGDVFGAFQKRYDSRYRK